MMKLFFRHATIKDVLLLLQENSNLIDLPGLTKVPCGGTMSRLSPDVMEILDPYRLHERVIGEYNTSLGRVVIGYLSTEIPWKEKERISKGVQPVLFNPASATRYKARTTVEHTSSEPRDGYFRDKIYKRGCHARYEIALPILLTTVKKVRKVLLLYG